MKSNLNQAQLVKPKYDPRVGQAVCETNYANSAPMDFQPLRSKAEELCQVLGSVRTRSKQISDKLTGNAPEECEKDIPEYQKSLDELLGECLIIARHSMQILDTTTERI